MILIYTHFVRQFHYIMNLRFMIVIYTHFVRQSYYIMKHSFMILIYTCFAWQFYYTMNLQKKAGGFRQTFAKQSKSDRNEDGWQKSVIEILREIC